LYIFLATYTLERMSYMRPRSLFSLAMSRALRRTSVASLYFFSCLLEVDQGRLPLLALLEQIGQQQPLAVGVGILIQHALQFADGFLVQVQLQIDVGDQAGVGWVADPQVIQVGVCGLIVAGLQVQPGHVGHVRGILRAGLQGLDEHLDGLLIAALLLQQAGERLDRVGVGGLDLQDSPEVGFGLLLVTLLEVVLGQAPEAQAGFRIGVGHLLEDLQRALHLLGFQENLRQEDVGLDAAPVQGDHPLVGLDRVVALARPPQGLSLQQQGGDVIGVDGEGLAGLLPGQAPQALQGVELAELGVQEGRAVIVDQGLAQLVDGVAQAALAQEQLGLEVVLIGQGVARPAPCGFRTALDARR
jgi:hypothetical protein